MAKPTGEGRKSVYLMMLLAFIGFLWHFGSSGGGSSLHIPPPPVAESQQASQKSLTPAPPPPPAVRKERPQEMAMLESWGYNADRNPPRWKLIYKTMLDDFDWHQGKLTLTDYGADQGFFSISAAKAFPEAVSIPIELGGVGGTIWDKSKKTDALGTMKEKAEQFGVKDRLKMCKAKFSSVTFANLVKGNHIVDYQLILSVIHWFEMKDRKEFEAALITIFRAARTTILEFPYVGPRKSNMLGQVGIKNFLNWLDGREDPTLLITDAIANKEANSMGLKFKVEKLADLPWLSNCEGCTRPIYRVDIVDDRGPAKLDCSGLVNSVGCDPERIDLQTCQTK